MKTYSEITLKSWQRAILYLAVWLAVSVGVKFLADRVLNSVLLHVAYIMLILPAATLLVSFLYTRRCGLKPWLVGLMLIGVTILYFFFGFDDISPNFITVNLVSGFFGFGVGNVMKDEPAVAAQEDFDNERKKKKQAAEKSYVSILDGDENKDNEKRRK